MEFQKLIENRRTVRKYSADSKVTKEQIEDAAKAHGTRLLRDNVSELVQNGSTSIDELVRVTYAI